MTSGLALSALTVASGIAGATTTPAAGGVAPNATTCSPFRPATGEVYTTNNLLSIYLQKSACTDDNDYFKVAVHSHSINAVGNRAYGIVSCIDSKPYKASVLYRHVAYIPSYGAWGSPDPGVHTTQAVAGVIYKPRAAPDLPYEEELYTACIS